MHRFHLIAPTVYFHHRKSIASETDSDSDSTERVSQDPKVILLFPWTGAQPCYITKYIDKYLNLFPTSSIMLITTSIKDVVVRSSRQKQRRLLPALHTLLTHNLTTSILVHTFSEGGSNKFVEFAEAYQRLTGARLSISSLCLDSTPGRARSEMLVTAFISTLPNNQNRAVRVLGSGASHVIRFVDDSGLYTHISQKVILKTRTRLNDMSLFEDVENTPRCYLYSAKDSVVHFQDVEEHAVEATIMGVKEVRLVRFEESRHCGHVREDEARYWDGVQKTWKTTVMKSVTVQRNFGS